MNEAPKHKLCECGQKIPVTWEYCQKCADSYAIRAEEDSLLRDLNLQRRALTSEELEDIYDEYLS